MERNSEINAEKLTLPYAQHSAKQQQKSLEFYLSISKNFKFYLPSKLVTVDSI